MNGKSVDKDEAAFNNEANMGEDARLETASETRKERIRRLNRERQRRRRQKLKLSRQVESGLTPTSPPSNVNLFETQHEPNEDAQTVNAELPTPTGQRKTKPTRRRQSPRKLKIKQESEFEEVSSDLSSTNTTTQPEVCHENANEVPGTSSDTVCVQIPVPLVATEIEVEDENYFDDDEDEFLDEELDLSDEDDEERSKAREGYRRRCDRMSEDDLATRREYYRDRERKKRQTMTPNEVSARREKQRELKRKQKERMTPDQIEALRARYREWRRKRKETMTPEQLEIIRRGNRERQRRRRERLGIRKRAATSQPKGVSDAVLLGIKNRHGRSLSETEAIFNIADTVPTTMKRGRAGNPRSSSTTTGRKHHQGPQAVPLTGPQAIPLPIMQPVIATGPGALPSVSTLAGPNTAIPTHQSQTTVPGGIPPLQTAPLPGLTTIAQGAAQNTGSVSATGGAIYQSMPLPGVQGFLHSMPVASGAQGTMLTGFQGTPMQGMQGMGAGTFIPPTMSKDGQVLHSISTLLPVAPMQGMGQGLTFLTPVTGTGPMATMQGFPDPRYVMAAPVRPQNPSQLITPTQQVTGLVQGAEAVSITMPQEPVQQVALELKISASEIQPPTLVIPDAPPPTLTLRGKGRGRKRAATVAAADVLASLSAGSPGNTPMASMLSAMASAKGGSANQQIPPQPAPAQEQTANIVATKRQNIEQVNFQGMPVGATMTTQQINQATGAVFGMASAVPGKTPLNQPTTVAQQIPAERKSYTTLTTAVTSLPMDMNANTFASFPAQNVAGFPTFKGFETLFANIPNANVYRGPYGMPIVDTRSGNLMGYGQLPEQQLNLGNRISIAVETDEIKRASVGTNTGDIDSDADMSKVNVESVGTMTDSLYKASVGTETDVVDTEDVSERTEASKENETPDKSEIQEESNQWERIEKQEKNEEEKSGDEEKSEELEISEKMESHEEENPPDNNKLLTADHDMNVDERETAPDLMDTDVQGL